MAFAKKSYKAPVVGQIVYKSLAFQCNSMKDDSQARFPSGEKKKQKQINSVLKQSSFRTMPASAK